MDHGLAMDDSSKDPILDRLDRLSERLMERMDRLEERLRALEQDNGEIISLLIAIRAQLEDAACDLMIEQPADPDDAETGDGAGGGAAGRAPYLH
ncbi:hypothetical protein [Azospirillum thermophilum]|uniref:SlyX protein n=1 Tax=Azospirillum thermophilum TaxID=2202148 RepID=A0A2S2CTU6_9PROT|nr:hypothetical protein [Azospirillum thermophilum]AWK87835.1 hypothetical protein DEW08_18045 [Azospirillum thermophilum]